MCVYIYIYIYISKETVKVRPFFILGIFRPIMFESKLENHCAKKLDGALRKPTSFV